jgi:hypothetical protein
MKVGNLWRMRYDALLIENEKLKKDNLYLKGQLTITIIALVISIIYSIGKIFI